MKKNILVFSILCLALISLSTTNVFSAEKTTNKVTITHLEKDTPDGWFDEFDKAQTYAEKEKKPMLLFFTGSDWCPWCVKLHEEVLDKKEFRKYAAANLTLVYLDFPENKKQSDAIKKQNKQLAGKYSVDGYPCTVLVSPDGKTEYGRIGGYTADLLKKLQEYVEKANGKASAANTASSSSIPHLDKDTPDGWFDELDKAQAYSEKEKKPMLLFFTGSDWCPWCVKLHEEVLDKDAFKQYAAQNLTLVYLDYPRKKELPAAIKTQNAKLPNQFSVSGYPCSILVSTDMKTVYGRISGYSADFLKKVQEFVDVANGKKTAAPPAKKAAIDDLKKIFDYLPETIGTIGEEKIANSAFYEQIAGNDLEVLTKIAKDRKQVKELIETVMKIKAMKVLIAKSGLKADADMFRNLLKKQCAIMPPADKDKLQKQIQANGFKTLDTLIEANVKKAEGKYEDMLLTAYKFSLAESLAKEELSGITDKEVQDFYNNNQKACTVDGKVLPLDSSLKEDLKQMVAMRKAAEKVPEKLNANIAALGIKINDFVEKK